MSLKSKIFLSLCLIASVNLCRASSSTCKDISGVYFCSNNGVEMVISQEHTDAGLLSYRIQEFGLTQDNTPIEATFVVDKKRRTFPGANNQYMAACHSTGLRIAILPQNSSSYHNIFEYLLTDEGHLFVGGFVGLIENGDIENAEFIQPGSSIYCTSR